MRQAGARGGENSEDGKTRRGRIGGGLLSGGRQARRLPHSLARRIGRCRSRRLGEAGFWLRLGLCYYPA
jgi:hypothetical protein